MNAKNNSNHQPLHMAIYHGNVEMVKLLLEIDADVNVKDKIDYSAFHFATHNESILIIQILLDRGADINAKTLSGLTPLLIVEKLQNVKIIKFFYFYLLTLELWNCRYLE